MGFLFPFFPATWSEYLLKCRVTSTPTFVVVVVAVVFRPALLAYRITKFHRIPFCNSSDNNVNPATSHCLYTHFLVVKIIVEKLVSIIRIMIKAPENIYKILSRCAFFLLPLRSKSANFILFNDFMQTEHWRTIMRLLNLFIKKNRRKKSRFFS